MTIKANNKIVASRDNQHVILHVCLTPESKNPINEESLVRFSARDQTSAAFPMRHPRMPEECHADQRCAPRDGARGRDARGFSA